MSSLVSVIVISHNRFPLLKYAVESVLAQTYRDIELIIADDHSKDPRVREYLEMMARKKFAKVYFGPKRSEDFRKSHKMVAVMINEVYHLVTGEFISYLGDDNFYFPNRVGVYYRSLMELKADVMVGEVRWIMKSGCRRNQDSVVYNYPLPFLKGHEGLVEAIAPSNFICTDSVMHKRTETKWPEDTGNPPVDWRFWLELFKQGFRFKKFRYTGEEAFFPGSWREGLTMKQALFCVEGIMKNRKVVYVKNISKQKQKWNSGAGEINVLPGERVEFEKASYMGPNGIRMLLPGFIYDSDMNIPFEIKESEKPKKNLEHHELKEWEKEMQPKEINPVADIKIDLIQEAEEKSPFDIESKTIAVASSVETPSVIEKIADVMENLKEVPSPILEEESEKPKRGKRRIRKRS